MGAAVGAVGLGIQAAGMIGQFSGQKKQAAFQQQELQLQQQDEQQRQQMMNLDANRRRREMVRQSIQAQSTSIARGVNQGAEAPNTSALPGAMGQIAGEVGNNLVGLGQNQQIGNNIFGINSQITGASIGAAKAGSSASMWGGLGSLGGMLVKEEGAIDRVGNYLGFKS